MNLASLQNEEKLRATNKVQKAHSVLGEYHENKTSGINAL